VTSRVELYDRLPLLGTDRWWLDQARSAPGGRVLELGAGTGRLTRAFAAAASHVTAVERDPDMTARLRQRTAGDNGNVEVVCADVADPEAVGGGPDHGLVALPSSLLNEAADLDARRGVLATARRCCRPDGHVALQLLGPWWLAGLPAQAVGQLHPIDGGAPIEVTIESVGFEPGAGRRQARLTYRFADGAVLVDDLDASVITPGELDLLLAEAGLEPVGRWGPLPPTPVDVTDPVWHLLARPCPTS